MPRFSPLFATAALLLVTPAHADTGDSERNSQDARHTQCVFAALGLANTTIYGSEYGFNYDGLVPAVEGGYGYCGAHVDLGGTLRLVPGPSFSQWTPAFAFRLHTGSPVDSGTEVGLGLGLGLGILHGAEENQNHGPFTGVGPSVAASIDLRHWFDAEWGLVVAISARADLTKDTDTGEFFGAGRPWHQTGALQASVGGVYRF
jgi:hypothetical protein